MLPITVYLLFDLAASCANKLNDDLKESKNRIILMESVLDANQNTINNLESKVKEKENQLKQEKEEKEKYFNRWNATDDYIKYMHQEFLNKQAQ